MSKLTQKEKILILMCREPNKWFYPYEFMTPDLEDLFVGYKAPTRLAELSVQYPSIFEIKSEDKYKQRKLNVKQKFMWYQSLDKEHKEIVDRELVAEPKAVSWLND